MSRNIGALAALEGLRTTLARIGADSVLEAMEARNAVDAPASHAEPAPVERRIHGWSSNPEVTRRIWRFHEAQRGGAARGGR